METRSPRAGHARRRRLTALLVRSAAAAMVWMAGSALPAAAHGVSGTASSNYRTTLDAIAPEPTGFVIEVIEAGRRLELRYLRGQPVIVRGYDGEPYLRVGPDGVEENLQSPATYVNRTMSGTAPLPDGLQPDGPPRWRRSGSEPVARWHDHRTHWMGAEPPDAVRADPSLVLNISDWELDVVQGDTVHRVTGRLDWVPGPSATAPLVGATFLGLVPVALALWAGPRASRRRPVTVAVAAMLGALIAIDVYHLLGIVTEIRGGSALARFFSVGYASIVAWLLGLAGAALALRRRSDGLYLMTFAAGLVALVGGMADLSSMSKSSLAFAYDPRLGRWSIAVSLGLGLGVAVAAVLLTRHLPRPVAPDAPGEAGAAGAAGAAGHTDDPAT
jgi:hypothetical protein